MSATAPLYAVCKCGKQFRAVDDLAGQRVPCPGCGTTIAIPFAETPWVTASRAGATHNDLPGGDLGGGDLLAEAVAGESSGVAIADPLGSSHIDPLATHLGPAATEAKTKKKKRKKKKRMSSERAGELRGMAAMQLVGGGLLVAGGIGASIWSYQAASEGESYYMFHGLVLVGVVLIFNGIRGIISPSED